MEVFHNEISCQNSVSNRINNVYKKTKVMVDPCFPCTHDLRLFIKICFYTAECQTFENQPLFMQSKTKKCTVHALTTL